MGAQLTVHYHGTPISPISAFIKMKGRNFCVSHACPRDIKRAHDFGQSVMLDNGAFSKWKSGRDVDWEGYYEWCDHWLNYPTTWAVIPDEIEGDVDVQESLIKQWPHGHRGVPVWHMHEPIERTLKLLDEWPRVCFGSSAQYATVGNKSWMNRMDDVFNAIERRHRRVPWIHMLRGMQCVKWGYPFASVDSTDIAQSHSRTDLGPDGMANRWDAMQCPPRWVGNLSLFGDA